MKHNKKRNTAFLYEILLREGTKASLEKDFQRLRAVKDLIMEFFHPESALGYELSLYKALQDNTVDSSIGQKVLLEVKTRHSVLSRRILFNEQTSLINKINKTLGHEIYNNFIPNYKNLATIFQIFNDSTPIKEKILLEESLLQNLSSSNAINEELKPIDSIVYKTFVKKFNDKYSDLLSEQKDLLSKYVSSFADEGLELKVHINEEIERLSTKINSSLINEEIKNDKILLEKTKKLFSILEDFKITKSVTPSMLENLLKIQQFVHEVEK